MPGAASAPSGTEPAPAAASAPTSAEPAPAAAPPATAGAKLRAELNALKVSELATLAAAEGADVGRIAAAIDGDKTKFELVELLLRVRAKAKAATKKAKKANEVPALTARQIGCVLTSTILVLILLCALLCMLTNVCYDAFVLLNAVGVGIQGGQYQAPTEGDGAMRLTSETFDDLVKQNNGVGKTTVVEFYGESISGRVLAKQRP